MSLVMPNEGEVAILGVALKVSSPEDLVLHLYTNDYTPDETSTLSSFTEVSGFGYAPITMSPSDWTLVAGDPTVATAVEKMWSFTGNPGGIYGYYVTGNTSGKVYWAERFTNAPIIIQNIGDRIYIPLAIGLS